MQVVILAGGFGTRIAEETSVIPKPLVRIGQDPILVHLIRYFASYGHTDFIIALGFKGYLIKEYFANYVNENSNFEIDFQRNKVEYFDTGNTNWKIKLIDTGEATMTGGRLLRLKSYLDKEFFLTYGDGLSDVNLDDLENFHNDNNTIATVTAVKPPARYGSLNISNDFVTYFGEKVEHEGSWINGGFFRCNKKILDYIEDDATVFEKKPMEKLIENKQLKAFQHSGYWQCMDNLRDKMNLEKIWNSGNAPWIRHSK